MTHLAPLETAKATDWPPYELCMVSLEFQQKDHPPHETKWRPIGRLLYSISTFILKTFT